jgi:FkbM family methyltransferase
MPLIHFSDIPTSSILGRSLRWILGWIPAGTVVPVLQGTLRGTRWIVGAQTHGMWLGSYEVALQCGIGTVLKKGQVFYDIGANVGFYSLLGARLVGEGGRVYAFEPLSRNLHYLNRHILLNKISNVTIVPKALSNYVGLGYFEVKGDSTSHLSDSGIFGAEVTTLDAFLGWEGVKPPDVMKIDVEGEELNVMEGATKCLSEYHPLIFLSIHSEGLYTRLWDFVSTLGYRVQTLDGWEAKRHCYESEVILR